MGQCAGHLLHNFDQKTMILGVPAPPCAGLGQGLESDVKKTISARNHQSIWVPFFEHFLDLLRLIFHSFLS